MTAELCRRRFTVDEYHRMGEAGVLREGDHVELLDGEVLVMSPIGRRHAAMVDRLTHLFVSRLGDAAIVRVQNPVELDTHTELQPDLALLQPRQDFYASGHPRPEDVWLVIEVAETTLKYDRDVKMPAYAEAGIGEAWLIDLAADEIAVHRELVGGSYRQVQRVSRTGSLLVPTPRALQIPARDVLG